MTEHEHNFAKEGIVYEVQNYKLPGSGACPVFYYNSFFCTICLERRYEVLPVQTSSYDKIALDATPKIRLEEK